MTYPEDRKYTKEHEWVRAEGTNGVVGITFHAQAELGDIVFVNLPKVGAKAEKGLAMGSVESVKAVSDIYSPVSGEITEVNALLTATPERLNEDPHGEAWLVKLTLRDPGELDSLLSGADYQSYVGE